MDGFDDSILDELSLDGDEDGDAADVSQPEDAVPNVIVPPEREETNKHICTPINVINTNVRSLCPKIDSLIDCIEELDVTVGIVTETWLADGDSLERDLRDLAAGAGIDMLCLNRRPNERGVAHGGVAIVANNSACTLRRVDLPNPGQFEVIVGLSTLPGYSRKLLTVGCYLPPTTLSPRAGRHLIT